MTLQVMRSVLSLLMIVPYKVKLPVGLAIYINIKLRILFHWNVISVSRVHNVGLYWSILREIDEGLSQSSSRGNLWEIE